MLKNAFFLPHLPMYTYISLCTLNIRRQLKEELSSRDPKHEKYRKSFCVVEIQRRKIVFSKRPSVPDIYGWEFWLFDRIAI